MTNQFHHAKHRITALIDAGLISADINAVLKGVEAENPYRD